MPPFRLGLIGAGRMGRTHLRALAGSEQVAVTAIAEMSAAAREAVPREGAAPGLTLHASVAEMLEAAAVVTTRRATQWWPVGQGVGYGASFANQAADLLEGWPEAPWTPGFLQGAAVQAVCDAMETSAASGRWVRISEVTGKG